MFSLFYSTFTSEYVYAVFMLFLSSECVCAVHGSFTSEYVYAVLCYFSQANVFALFIYGTFQAVCALRSLSIMGGIQNLIICVKMAWSEHLDCGVNIR